MEEEDQKALSHSPVDDDDRKALALSSCSSSSSSLEPNKSIAERRAAKLGFNAYCIKTALFQTGSPAGSPPACSPRLFISPGISPTTLLDSPVMLPNSQALPSPTTGTFRLPSFSHGSSILYSAAEGDGDRRSDLDSFGFMPYEDSNSLSTFPKFIDKGADLNYEDDVSVQPSMDFEFPAELSKADTTENCALDLSTDLKVLKNMGMNGNIDLHIHHSDAARDQKSLPKESIDEEDVGTNNLLEEDLKGLYPSTGTMRASEDGYNWRKYGQKQVKGSEYPRSYYKCTHPNCHVKKKVERSQDGQITEIIYKGTHNHAKPLPNRRASLGSSFSMEEMSEMMDEVSGSFVKVEGGSVWRNVQPGMKDMIKLGPDWRSDGVEGASSVSVVSDLSDPLSFAPGKSVGVLESFETPELSSTIACHDDDDDEEEDGATQGSISRGDNADEDESESKRRKKESCLIETNLASRAVREPRVVVQIESEVDILEDGYRWRKYGQKVVKGNPNPRSYYKCTSAGCCVRKHVERASHNIKCVITTYEGKHNHEVPAARNSIPVNSSTGNVPSTVANAQPALTAARNTNSPKAETQAQELAPHFDRKLEFNNEYLRPSFLGNIGNDMKFGASSIYQMKFPPLQNTVPYATLRLNSNCNVNPHSYAPVVPDFPMPLPLNLPQAGFDFNVGKPAAPVQPFLSGQQLKEHDPRLLKPKQELKDNSLYEACLPIVDHANASSSSSSLLYPQVRRCFPS